MHKSCQERYEYLEKEFLYWKKKYIKRINELNEHNEQLIKENHDLKKQRDELVQSIVDTAKMSADAITKVWTGDDYD